GLGEAGWDYRRLRAEMQEAYEQRYGGMHDNASEDDGQVKLADVIDPFKTDEIDVFDPKTEQHAGVVLGIGLVSYRDQENNDRFLLLPGDDCQIAFPTTSIPLKVTYDSFTAGDLYESKMSESDQSFVFVPIEKLQQLRGMPGGATTLQIKLKPGRDLDEVRDRLKAAFPAQFLSISTWRDKQGPLLEAVRMETAILNVLLFLIIA